MNNLIRVECGYKPKLRPKASFLDDFEDIMDALNMQIRQEAIPVKSVDDFRAACWVANPDDFDQLGLIVVSQKRKNTEGTNTLFHYGTVQKTDLQKKSNQELSSLVEDACRIAVYQARSAELAILAVAQFIGAIEHIPDKVYI